MPFSITTIIRIIAVSLVMITVSSCGSGGANSNNSAPQSGSVVITGVITFDFVLATQAAGLNYAAIAQKPVRNVVIVAIKASDSSVLDSTLSDDSGSYSLTAPANTNIIIRVKAQMTELNTATPSWDISVVDNTSGQALYVMDSAAFDSGSGVSGKNLNAGSGWGGVSYNSTRAAGPFAILDVIYKAAGKIAAADPNATMPKLLINWSVNNTNAPGDKTLGQISTSHYAGDTKELFILGKADVDTDEYDDHVIAHEFGHVFEDRFSRSDNIAGSHSGSDKQDPRIAFGEGFGNAFSGMVTDDQHYIDTGGASQSNTILYNDIEVNNPEPGSIGWFSEASIESALYDIYDSADDGGDTLSLGFAPIYSVFVNGQKNAESFTSIYSFASFLKAANPLSAVKINSILQRENISSNAVDEWDSTGTETNDGGYAKTLPVYTRLTSGAPATNLCSSGQFGSYNKLRNRSFFYIEVAAAGDYTLTVVPDIDGDAVVSLYSKGQKIGGKDDFGNGVTETLTLSLTPGKYAGEVYEFQHIDGTTYTSEECFDITFN